MSQTEKLRALEDIWQDLAAGGEEFPSPQWHADVLKETEQAVATGAASFSDWESAKIRIRQRAALLK